MSPTNHANCAGQYSAVVIDLKRLLCSGVEALWFSGGEHVHQTEPENDVLSVFRG